MPARIVTPTPEAIAEAAERLQNGGLVALPTETVYGLGANALDTQAVAQIFAAKGRPSTNPLIVHVADVEAARALVSEWPPLAEKLAQAFWPGPLTLVLPKADTVPSIVTAGGQTVGVRVPAHPVALELLHAAGVPIAAPSANRSEEVSPTTAQHVADSLGEFVDDLLILDGGPCSVGLESTVLDVTTGDVPRILRPGMVTAQMLHEVVGEVLEGSASNRDVGPERSPGQMVRHYAPHFPVILVTSTEFRTMPLGGCGVLNYSAIFPRYQQCKLHQIHYNPGGYRTYFQMPEKPEKYAARLYRGLRELDQLKTITRIVIELPPDAPEWAAVHDRLRRAAAPKEGA